MQANPRYNIHLERVAIALAIFGYLIFTYIAQGGPSVINETYGDARLQFSVSRQWVALPGECVALNWNVEGIDEIRLNIEGVTGVEQHEVCLDRHQEFDFWIIFRDGTEQHYKLQSQVLLLFPPTWFLLIIAGIVLIEARRPAKATAIPSADKQSDTPIYFPGLNGIRFMAAFAVVIWHIWQFQYEAGFDTFSNTFTGIELGEKAVTLFFVLSSFLITYLLLAEYHKTDTIRVREFYIRRFLRIWPLYYLVVAVAFFILPHIDTIQLLNRASVFENFGQKLLVYGLFLPNVAPILELRGLFLSHTWSIGVEEQFYLLWPQLMKRFARHLFVLLLAIIVIKWGVVALLELLSVPEESVMGQVRYFGLEYFEDFQIDNMALGGIGAYILFYRKRALQVLFHPLVERAALVLVPLMMLSRTDSLPQKSFLLSIVFMVFIVNIAANPNALIRLENRPFNYLGKISYGMYMYHPMVIILSLTLLQKTALTAPPGGFLLFNLLLYSMSIVGTIALAAVSYRFYESFFLRLKHRFTVVSSGVPSETVSL